MIKWIGILLLLGTIGGLFYGIIKGEKDSIIESAFAGLFVTFAIIIEITIKVLPWIILILIVRACIN